LGRQERLEALMDLLDGHCTKCGELIAMLMLRAATTEFYGTRYANPATYCEAASDYEHRFVFHPAPPAARKDNV
jgi:hypothetical protein